MSTSGVCCGVEVAGGELKPGDLDDPLDESSRGLRERHRRHVVGDPSPVRDHVDPGVLETLLEGEGDARRNLELAWDEADVLEQVGRR